MSCGVIGWDFGFLDSALQVNVGMTPPFMNWAVFEALRTGGYPSCCNFINLYI